jgi:ribosomal protein L44E
MALPQLNTAKYTTVIPSLDKEVTFRPYLVKEEKILMIAMESQDNKQIIRAIKDVIKACVFDDIDVEKLAMFDIEAIFLALRSKSVGERVDVRLKCNKCEQLTDVNINLDDVQLPEGSVNNVIQLNDSVGVTMRYPSINDVEGMNQEGGVKEMMKIIGMCIENIFDDDNVYESGTYSEKELNDFIDGLNSSQFQKISKFFEDLPAIQHNVKFNCVSCNEKNDVELKGIASFFT